MILCVLCYFADVNYLKMATTWIHNHIFLQKINIWFFYNHVNIPISDITQTKTVFYGKSRPILKVMICVYFSLNFCYTIDDYFCNTIMKGSRGCKFNFICLSHFLFILLYVRGLMNIDIVLSLLYYVVIYKHYGFLLTKWVCSPVCSIFISKNNYK